MRRGFRIAVPRLAAGLRPAVKWHAQTNGMGVVERGSNHALRRLRACHLTGALWRFVNGQWTQADVG